jgi:hypothetical protein
MHELVKTKPPINSILSLLLLALLITLSITNLEWALYGPFTWLCFYIFFCRYCCVVTITATDLKVKYLAPWNGTINIGIRDITGIDYSKGYYDLNADKTIAIKMLLQYPYDRLILYRRNTDEPETYININTRIFGFDKTLAWAAALKLLKS